MWISDTTGMSRDAEPPEGYAPARCPVCKAAMEVYQVVSFGDESAWWGICPECGAEDEGETAQSLEAVDAEYV